MLEQSDEQGVKGRLLKKINIKQRQFNFSQQKVEDLKTVDPESTPQVENQIVLYDPVKKVKLNYPLVDGLEAFKNNAVTAFISQLMVVKSQIQQSDHTGPPPKQCRLLLKLQSKQNERLKNVCRMTWSTNPNDYYQIPPQLEFEYQMDEMRKMNELSDYGVINLSKNLQRLGTPNLKLDLLKKWHTDSSKISDSAVENLSKGIYQMPNLTDLQLGLQGWGYWNNNITNTALNHITTALSSLRQLNALKLDLNMWAYENEEITDKGTETLLGGISQLKELGKLEINMKGWGDSNVNITDESVNHLSKCLRKLGNLSEVKLVLWDKVSKDSIKKLNRALAELDNLTSVDLKFENSSDAQYPPSQQNNINPKLIEIKENALNKRKLLFQTAAINSCCDNLFRREKCWDIASKLIG